MNTVHEDMLVFLQYLKHISIRVKLCVTEVVEKVFEFLR